MDNDVKIEIATTGIKVLFKYGLPALSNLVTSLNDKDHVTIEDIQEAKKMIDSEDYFT